MRASVMFALEAGGEIFLKADDGSRPRFRGGGLAPVHRTRRTGGRSSTSYWLLPDGGLDDPSEAARWGALARGRRKASQAPRRADSRRFHPPVILKAAVSAYRQAPCEAADPRVQGREAPAITEALRDALSSARVAIGRLWDAAQALSKTIRAPGDAARAVEPACQLRAEDWRRDLSVNVRWYRATAAAVPEHCPVDASQAATFERRSASEWSASVTVRFRPVRLATYMHWSARSRKVVAGSRPAGTPRRRPRP